MEYDLVVIGGGPGGYTAAITGAKNGLKTLLIEKDKAGGTCLNRGCIPTKALLHCSGVYRSAMESGKFGVVAACSGFDYQKAFEHKEKTTNQLRRGVEMLVKKSGCTLMFGEAVLRDENTLTVSNEVIGFGNLIIATGSVPSAPPFAVEDGSNVLDSDGFLALADVPETVAIIGGGVIGMEFATILSDIGKKVVIIEAADRILPTMDKKLAEVAKKSLEDCGVSFYTNTFVQRIYVNDGKTECEVKQNDEKMILSADLVICATGRRANVGGLHIERAGIKQEKGFIETDLLCATNVPHIFAIGDVNGRCMLAHAASYQGKRVVQNIADKQNIPCVSAAVPACVYTNPELASVGLTEEDAKGRDIKTGYFNAAGNGKLLSMGENIGFAKIIADAKTDEILGAQIACAHATDMIAEIAFAITLEATVEELAKTIHPHPTASEIIMEAAEDYYGNCVHQ